MNKQWLLARPPPGGLPVADDFRLVDTPHSGARPTADAHPHPLPVAGPVSVGAAAQWGGSGGRRVPRPHCVAGGQEQHPRIPRRRFCLQHQWLAGVWPHRRRHLGLPVHVPTQARSGQAPISTAVGVLGMLGLTAYSGLCAVSTPGRETVVVSAASGGVGQIAGQIARILGCRVVGIAGIQEKCDFVTNLLALTRVSRTGAPTCQRTSPRPVLTASISILRTSVGRSSRPSCPCSTSRHASAFVDSSPSTAGDPGDAHGAWMAQGKATFERRTCRPTAWRSGLFSRYQAPFLALSPPGFVTAKSNTKKICGLGFQAPQAFGAMMAGGNFGKTLVGVGDDPTLDETLKQRPRPGTNVLSGYKDA